MTDTEICSRLLIGWNLENDLSKIAQLDNEMSDEFAIKVITKKLEWVGLDIKLNPFLKALLVICSQNNPAMVQLIMAEILRSIKSRGVEFTPDYEITSMDFSLAFPEEFPVKSVPHIDKKFEEKWDSQKDPKTGNNLVDTKEWWLDLIK